MSKEAFVAGIVKYELLAAQRTRAFYLQVFLPWAEKRKLPTDATLWFCDWWDTPEGVLKSFPTARRILGGLMPGCTTGPRFVAIGAAVNSRSGNDFCSGCVSRRAMRRINPTCRIGWGGVWPGWASRPRP